jgi:hypothetical protein
MDPLVAFVLGVVVGIGLILGAQALRRPPAGVAAPDASTTAPARTSPLGALVGRAESRAVKAAFSVGSHTRTVTHEAFEIRDTRTGATLRIADGATTVELDGRTYHRLEDVPEPQRSSLQDEIRQLERLDLPDLVRAELQKVLGGTSGPTRPPSEV